MLKNFFKKESEPQTQTTACFNPENDFWQVFDLIKNKDRREFNKFIEGTKSLYDAWQKYQPTLSKDEKIEQEVLNAENELEALAGDAGQ